MREAGPCAAWNLHIKLITNNKPDDGNSRPHKDYFVATLLKLLVIYSISLSRSPQAFDASKLIKQHVDCVLALILETQEIP